MCHRCLIRSKWTLTSLPPSISKSILRRLKGAMQVRVKRKLRQLPWPLQRPQDSATTQIRRNDFQRLPISVGMLRPQHYLALLNSVEQRPWISTCRMLPRTIRTPPCKDTVVILAAKLRAYCYKTLFNIPTSSTRVFTLRIGPKQVRTVG